MRAARRPRVRLLLVVALLVATTVTACGRRGLPRPPEDVRPETITDLEATATGAAIVLSWRRPEHYTDGSRMRDLARFEIERAPVADGPGRFERIATVVVDDQDRFRQLRRFSYEDGNVHPEQSYRYRVVSITKDRYRSAPSNEAEAALARPD